MFYRAILLSGDFLHVTLTREASVVRFPDIQKSVSLLLLFSIRPESDARAEVPRQSHGAGSALLHEANGDRRRVHPLAESRSPGSEAGQHVPVGSDDRQDRRLRTGDQA